MTPRGPGRSGSHGAAALVLGGLAVRLSDWAAVFRGGRVLFLDTDDYYHLRRIMAAAQDFPRLPDFDPYLGFPRGFAVNWPALYDRFVGVLTLLVGAGRPDAATSMRVAAFVPPLAGAATLWLFWRAARRLCGEAAALWAVTFAAVLPPLVFYTALGRPDHHCFENFWLLAVLLALLRVLDARDERGRARAAARLAAAGALGALFWIGAVSLASAVFLFVLVELAAARRGLAPAAAFFWIGAAFLAEAALLLPSGLTSRWGAAGEALFDAPSLFQPLALAAAGFGTWAFHWRRARGWRDARAAAAGAAAFAATALLAARGVGSLARYAAAPLPVFGVFSEMQPLLAPYGRWGPQTLLADFGWTFLLLPPLAFLYARAERRFEARLALCWAAVTGALALWQARYGLHFALPAALLLGWGAEKAAARLAPALGARGAALARAAVAAGALLLLAPALRNLAGLALAAPDDVTGSPDLLAACDWLRENTPPTRSLWRDEGPPEYGVYAIHSLGDQVAAIAQRPAAAGDMHFLPEAILDSIRFFFESSPDGAYAFLRERRFRYVLLDDMLHDGTLPMYARLFGLDGFDSAPRPDGGLALAPRVWSLVYPRLYVLDGTRPPGAAASLAPVEHFRLVYESPTERFGVRAYKIFEVVAGARVEGACWGGVVSAETTVRAASGREFVYRDEAACGADRRFRLALPYAGRYALGAGDRRGRLAVSEDDVVSGKLRRAILSR